MPVFETWEIAHKKLVFGEGGGVCYNSTPTHLSPFLPLPLSPLLHFTDIGPLPGPGPGGHLSLQASGTKGGVPIFSSLSVFPVNI